jgi:hypothetical protein
MELVHMDTMGPIQMDYKGYQYVIVVVDEVTHYTVIVFAKDKISIPVFIVNILKQMSSLSGKTLQAIRTDRGT